ncbi:MAG: AAA family ATPase [Clostridia bacterium]|nr:AAA family ATPase [Clostridia bacterium]
MAKTASRIRCFICDSLVLRKPNMEDLNIPFAIFTKKVGKKIGCVCSACIEDAEDEYERIIESDDTDFFAECWGDENGTKTFYQAGSKNAYGGASIMKTGEEDSQEAPRKGAEPKEVKLLRKKFQALDFSLDSIAALVKKKVFGQDEIVKRVVYTVYKNLCSNLHAEMDEPVKKHSHILLIGNTGVGKTFIAETVAKQFHIPYVRVDCSSFTSAGYVGDSVEQILERLYNSTSSKEFSADERLEIAENGIIILDELDKKKVSIESTGRDVTGRSVQQELLKFFEPSTIFIKNGTIPFDTSKLTIIATGAFVGLDDIIKKRLHLTRIGFKTDLENGVSVTDSIIDEDLFEFGLIPELVGRITVVQRLNDLSKETLTDIIYSCLSTASDYFTKKNFKLEVDPFLIENMAIRALEAKTGARDVDKLVEDLIYPALYEVLQSKAGGVCLVHEDSSIEILREQLKTSNAEIVGIPANAKYQEMVE